MKFIQRIRRSLSLQLLLLFVVAGILISLLFQVTLGLAVGHHIKKQVAPHLRQYAEYLQQDIGQPPDTLKAAQLSERLPVEITIASGNQHWQSSPLPARITDASLTDYFTTRSGQRIAYNFEREGVILRYQTEHNEQEYTVTLWGKGWQRPDRRRGGLLAGIIILLLMLTALYLLIRRLFRPVQTIRQGVQQIGSGDLTHRIQPARNDELGDLALSINHMADDIEHMLESKRELLLAISHELRSPLTRAKVSLALLEESPAQQNIHRDLNEMEGMISELLEAERLKGQHSSLNYSQANLNTLATEVVAEYFPTATIKTELDHTVPVLSLDVARIRLVIRNLLDNALKYQEEGASPVLLGTSVNGDGVRLSIQDHGPGIAAEHLPQLTEPFYRTDASRQRKTGGFGLGLYLVKLIVEAHGGRLTIASEVGKGTQVEVVFCEQER